MYYEKVHIPKPLSREHLSLLRSTGLQTYDGTYDEISTIYISFNQ